MKNKIEEALEKLEEYVVCEMDKIREMVNKQPKIKDLFSTTTYSEVCKELKEKEETCPYKKLKQVQKLFNSDYKVNIKDNTQQKWYPYFNITSGGLIFDVSGGSSSYCTSAVCFYKDKKTSDHIGKHFINLYTELYN